MPKPIENKEQLAYGPFEISDYPDKISDTTVAFASCRAVPDVLDAVADSAQWELRLGSVSLENAMVLDSGALMEEPEVEISTPGTYTLMLVDADAPSPNKPHYRCWLHWLVVNIPAHDPRRGEVVVAYLPPSPAGRGRHRYLALLFRQPGRLRLAPPSGRQGFQVRAFAKEHGLGDPAAGLFFWSAADVGEQ